jgi:hypothetical protein
MRDPRHESRQRRRFVDSVIRIHDLDEAGYDVPWAQAALDAE